MVSPRLKHYQRNALLIISAVGYLAIAYFIPRHETVALLASYTLLFGIYCFLLTAKNNLGDMKTLIVSAILFRLIFIGAFPLLSDDIYRFVWDGRLLARGIHPFTQVPAYYMEHGHEVSGLSVSLFNRLNSPEYFTIYPPFAQFVYLLSVLVSDSIVGSAIFIRVGIIGAELGTIFILSTLLDRYRQSKSKVLIYALNPLVIIELTGNLHFEAFMIFFLLLTIYTLHQHALAKAALFMAAGIASKLLPLMLLPLFLRRLKRQPLAVFYGWTMVFFILFFLPLFDWSLITGMRESISLYFQKFEFNASIYYVIREIGYLVKGYNVIGTVGKYLPLFTIIVILYLSLKKPKTANIFETMLWVFTVYLLMATTVHPWYITTIVAFSVFTSYRFGILWSILIFFTYAGYSLEGFHENYIIVNLEYLLVGAFIIYEMASKGKRYGSTLNPS